MTLGTRTRALLIAGTCAAVGAGGGIVGSMAAPSKHRTSTAKASRAAPGPPMRGFRHGGPGHGAVHAEEVVLNRAGTGFITETEDSGKVKTVSGGDVTITEGTDTVAYKDVTITIPDGAKIVRDGASATVADLKAGDFVHVSRSSDGAFVFAADASWRPRMDGGRPGFGRPGPPPGPPPQGSQGY